MIKKIISSIGFFIMVAGIALNMYPAIGELSIFREIGIGIAVVGAALQLISTVDFKSEKKKPVTINILIMMLFVGMCVVASRNIIPFAQDMAEGPIQATITNCQIIRHNNKKAADSYRLVGMIEGKQEEFVIESYDVDTLSQYDEFQIEYFVHSNRLVSCSPISQEYDAFTANP